MARCGFAFDQCDASSRSGERDRSGTTCHSTTQDENFVLQSIAPNSLDNRRAKNSLSFRSEQIVILGPIRSWLDGCTYRGENMLGSLGVRSRKASWPPFGIS